MAYLSGNAQYLLINGAIGVGIAADAVIATIGRFRRFERIRDALTWAAAIGFTHTVFPMIGLIGLWYAASAFPSLKATIYGIGFIVMVWFITSVIREIAGLDNDDEDTEDQEDFLYQFLANHSKFWAAVWAVSIDALVTGPGKTAATAHWSQAQVLGSFPLVGFVVFGLVMLSAWPAIALRNYWQTEKFNNPHGLARFTMIGSWVELSIFLYFAYLAVSEMLVALGIHPIISEFAIAGIFSSLTTVVLLLALRERVWHTQLQEAKKLIE
ncbi:MAG: manganese efflux pump [Cyanobacteria bacterium J06638_28]